MKTCTQCSKTFPATKEYFHKDKLGKDGLRPDCKECVKEYHRKYYQENKEKYLEYNKEYRKENKEIIKERRRKYYRENIEIIKERKKKYYQENKEKVNEYSRKYNKEYRQENRKKINLQKKERKKKDPMFRMIENQRRRINHFLKANNYRKNSSTAKLLGCSPKQLREHLRKQYQQGMTDHNYGKWHIDHIIPLASAKSQEEVVKLCHFTNLQPLWAQDNWSKGDKFPCTLE